MELMLKNVRIAFCQSALGEAEDYEGNKNFRHSATFIVEPGSDNDKLIQSAIKTEAATLWGKKAEGMLEDMRGSKTQWCYPKNKKDKSGEVYEGFEGMFALGSHRAYQRNVGYHQRRLDRSSGGLGQGRQDP